MARPVATSVPDYSVIVPAHQATGVIGACVRALAQQTIERTRYEIIVVDDGSVDATGDAAREAGADRVVRIPHGGPSTARNAGIEAAQGEIVLFTDADCEPAEDWIACIVAPLADPQVMGVKGTYRTRQSSLIARLVQLEFEIRYARMAELEHIDFIDTYAAAYRRALLVEYGCFDTAFPIPSAEDVDLSFRLARAGHWLVFAPDAWVWHQHPATLGRYLARKARFGYWRALLYVRYPDKISGDAHTDPTLKPQFALAALLGLSAVVGVFWPPAWLAALFLLVLFLATTLSFVRWAWQRDRAVALLWPAVTLLRVVVQGLGLALGLLRQVVK
ncbi:MAG: glycosyltransferase [Anaerolineae bacterium]|nr:glycosyltransferase [Anaerolineae bacterium]